MLDIAELGVPPVKTIAHSVVRVLMPNRAQVELRASDLDSLLPEDHRARLVWAYVMQVDLGRMYAGIKAVEGGCGRTPIAPEILFALWLYATVEGVGSARALARLMQEQDAYRWLCGGVSVNYHTLSDFRTNHGEALDGLLTDSVAALLAVKAVKLKRVAQDGMRVRASAGAASFRRRRTLEQHLGEARQQMEALKQQLADDPGALSRRQQAARTRAAREREEKVRKAVERLPELEQIKVQQGKKPEDARASTTEAEATIMKMGDGGFRPAYNAQLATDTETQVIAGVEVVTTGSDMAQLVPMVEQVTERYHRTPEEWLVDGGFPAHEQMAAVADQTTVYAPVPKPKNPATDPYAPKPGDSAPVREWRQRMGTEEAKLIYKDRAATAECVNALARNRGLQQWRVRGTAKVRCVLLFHALAHNLLRTFALAPELLGLGTGMPEALAFAA
ncbi:MAG TPA: IS1182 family transposase [Candidatus Competibacteraceae bacterium]|nr:IS1182 family transposase [Candidatus Competibacteraceae bacterium]